MKLFTFRHGRDSRPSDISARSCAPRSLHSPDSSGAPRRREHHSSAVLFLLLLFAVLIIIGELLICMGTGVYQNVLTSMDENDSTRTASAYILQKVRQGQDAGAIRLEDLDGCSSIVIRQSLNGDFYDTYLYCQEGELRELMIRADNTAARTAEAGTFVTNLDDMQLQQESEDLLQVTLVQDEDTQQLRILLQP